MIIHDFDGLAKKFKRLSDEGVNQILRNIAEAVGETLLNLVIDEIGKQDLIDTGLMWNSFTRGESGNVWEWDVDRNAISLEVGSSLGTSSSDPGKAGYPRMINDGYTIHKAHFVPGYWATNGTFVHDPSAKTGFMARPRTFIGRHYFDIAVKELEGGMNALITKRLEKELGRMLS
ncbi:HK97 gp10 family phage protein [Paenibacillus donghaensis]|uniref:Terminase n=1 Tax=Paenibacillus donghaensis TaxID=414771 RepID=A0A2Z2KP48_9BACL|nr:HK97 gp10 family phage protein [Paenibacillus donghaensis]ASA21961.1 terminase [Paenibacillus donghaensis]